MIRNVLMAAPLALLLGANAEAGPRQINACGTIANPGSYVLARNINGTAAAGDCIQITASHVTLDLNGFGIGGPGLLGNAAGGYGIRVYDPVVGVSPVNVVVQNGSVTGFQIGVYFDLFSEGGVVDGVRVIDNEWAGIHMQGEASVVRNSVAIGNGTNGIDVNADGAVITGNIAYNNSNYGIHATCNSVIMGNAAKGNVFNGDINVTNQGGNCAYIDNSTVSPP